MCAAGFGVIAHEALRLAYGSASANRSIGIVRLLLCSEIINKYNHRCWMLSASAITLPFEISFHLDSTWTFVLVYYSTVAFSQSFPMIVEQYKLDLVRANASKWADRNLLQVGRCSCSTFLCERRVDRIKLMIWHDGIVLPDLFPDDLLSYLNRYLTRYV